MERREYAEQMALMARDLPAQDKEVNRPDRQLWRLLVAITLAATGGRAGIEALTERSGLDHRAGQATGGHLPVPWAMTRSRGESGSCDEGRGHGPYWS